MRKFHIATLGCKINQYESEALAEAWRARGHAEVEEPGRAEVVLVNSCAVTSRAVKDLRALVRRLRKASPGARIVVTGCAAQLLGQELSALPGVDAVVPQDRKAALLAWPFESDGAPFGSSTGVAPGADALPRPFPPFEIAAFRRARAVVKVQDGCSHRCTYCIVPFTRGPSVSRDPGAILAEMRRLLQAGYRELVLSGVNLRQYGRDLPGEPSFWDLLELVERELAPEWAGRARLRLSSVEPGQLDEQALDVLCASRLVAPHLHLSLQSGDAEVLRRMGRGHYRPELVLEFLARLRRAWPRLGLGADLITGFPGETAAQFENSYAFCRELPLTYAHVFPYSPRPGTPAAQWSDGLAKAERTSRAARLRGLAESRRRAFLKSLAALPVLTVLVEGVPGRQGDCLDNALANGFGNGRDEAAGSGQPYGVARRRVIDDSCGNDRTDDRVNDHADDRADDSGMSFGAGPGSAQALGVCEFYGACAVRTERGGRPAPGSLVAMRPEGVENGRVVGTALGEVGP